MGKRTKTRRHLHRAFYQCWRNILSKGRRSRLLKKFCIISISKDLFSDGNSIVHFFFKYQGETKNLEIDLKFFFYLSKSQMAEQTNLQNNDYFNCFVNGSKSRRTDYRFFSDEGTVSNENKNCQCCSVQTWSSYLGESSEEPLTCSGVLTSGESTCSSVTSTMPSRSSSDVLLSPKSSKCSSSPPIRVTMAGWWPWSSEFRENLEEA